MSYIGDISAALDDLRIAAESRMTSTCAIESVATETDSTGAVIITVTPVWSGPCRLRTRDTMTTQAGQSTHSVMIDQVHIPVWADGVRTGHRLTVTDACDPRLIGNVYRVRGVHEADQTTAQRLGVESWGSTLVN